MRKSQPRCLPIAILCLLSACGQTTYGESSHQAGFTNAAGDRALLSPWQPRSASTPRATTEIPAWSSPNTLTASYQDPDNRNSNNRNPNNNLSPRFADELGRPYGQTRARLQLFREDIERDNLDIKFDNAPDGRLRDMERDRVGFRAEFGQRAVGGFFQVFREKLRAPTLLGEEFTNYGVGGGVAGAPTVGHVNQVTFVVPLRLEINAVVGSESVGGFDQDLGYLEGSFELGFGARMFGLQSSSGIIINSFAGLFDSDNPASLANSGAAAITGTNIGAYFEVLYKHDRVPLMARARAIIGDVSGVLLTFGFAF